MLYLLRPCQTSRWNIAQTNLWLLGDLLKTADSRYRLVSRSRPLGASQATGRLKINDFEPFSKMRKNAPGRPPGDAKFIPRSAQIHRTVSPK